VCTSKSLSEGAKGEVAGRRWVQSRKSVAYGRFSRAMETQSVVVFVFRMLSLLRKYEIIVVVAGGQWFGVSIV
jgi:hypothetical protein